MLSICDNARAMLLKQGDKIHHSGLAGSRFTNNSHCRVHRDREIDVLQSWFMVIGKRDLFKLDALV